MCVVGFCDLLFGSLYFMDLFDVWDVCVCLDCYNFIAFVCCLFGCWDFEIF